MSAPALEEIPLRAQIGYVLEYGNVVEGEFSPAAIVGILAAKGVLDADPEGAKHVAAEVLEARGIEWGEDSE